MNDRFRLLANDLERHSTEASSIAIVATSPLAKREKLLDVFCDLPPRFFKSFAGEVMPSNDQSCLVCQIFSPDGVDGGCPHIIMMAWTWEGDEMKFVDDDKVGECFGYREQLAGGLGR
jgi:hypothetical protein